jgi:hypothetical protein
MTLSGTIAGTDGATVENPRWNEAAAHLWYDGLPWLVGCNFTPSYAINQLEF